MITIHHPTSLTHGVPALHHGKLVAYSNSMLRMKKSHSVCGGCGGWVTFKEIVISSTFTYRVTKNTSTGLQVGTEKTITAKDLPDATGKLALELGINDTEARECCTVVNTKITDENKYSELYCYVACARKQKGEQKWIKNDLDLEAMQRWNASGQMVIDIYFKGKSYSLI